MSGKLHMPKILLVNGPKDTGKDTTFQILYNAFNCGATPIIEEKFSKPLKRGIPAMFGIPFDDLEATKDDARDELHGRSFRQVQISLSEKWFKEEFGNEIFGHMCVTRINQMWMAAYKSNLPPMDVQPLYVITDSGFVEEAAPVVAAWDHDGSQCRLIRLHRTGHEYDGDSRGYVADGALDQYLVDQGNCKATFTSSDIHADSVEELTERVLRVVGPWLRDTA